MSAETLREIRKTLDVAAEDLERVADEVERVVTLERLEQGGSLELVGIAEVAEIIGKKPRAVSMAQMRGRMPKPVAQLAMGTVWLRAHIDEWWAVEQDL